MATCGGAMKGEEIDFAVIKNNKQHRSSPSQHMADFYELEYSKDPVHAKLLWNPDGRRKVILSLEVDGGPDENPGHAETRWLLAECMVGGPRLRGEMTRALVVANTRAANDTHLNFVERVNGSETSAHANAFFGDDAIGDLHDQETGQLDPGRVEKLHEFNTEKLRSLIDGAPGLNGATLTATIGASSASACEDTREVLARRPLLLRYLHAKGSPKKSPEPAWLARLHPPPRKVTTGSGRRPT